MQQLTRTVARNSAFGLGAQLTIKVLSFGFTVSIVRQLGAETYGQYAAVLAFGALFVFLADLGLSPWAVREVARARDAANGSGRVAVLFGNLLRLRLVLAVLAAVLLVAAAWLTDRPPVMVGAIALGALGLIVYAVHGTCDAVLMGFERFGIGSAAKVANQLVFVGLGAGVLVLGLSYHGLIVANLLGIALMTYLCWRGVCGLGVTAGPAEPRAWPGLLRASIPFGMIAFTLGLSYKFDSVVLNIARGDVETGYYNAAYNLVFSAAMLSNVLNTALYPSLARQAATAPETLPAIYARALRYLMLVALPIAVGLCVLAEPVVSFLFTETYAPTAGALQLVIWAVPLMFASEFLGYVVVIQGREQRVARALLVSTALNVALNLLLVPLYGFQAAAAMTVLTEAVLVGQYVWLLRGLVWRGAWAGAVLRPLAAAVLMGIVVYLLRDLPLGAVVGIGAGTYGVLLLLLGAVGADELRVARGLVGSGGPAAAAELPLASATSTGKRS